MKKQLLTIAIITLSIVSLTFADTYTAELQDAYGYAYNIGITTQPSIDSANMYGSLIRAHMAKMLVNYAKQVLGATPDTSLPCNFTDVGTQSQELQGYIKQACQLGLMGIGITAFNPNDVVTRAQFGTVLSRALYGNFYNDGSPYYIFHVQALKEAGIMTKIDAPDMNEVRGYVMLMMMRVGGNAAEEASPCDTQTNQLLCMIGSTECPAECQQVTTITTTSGTLTIAKDTSSAGSLPAGSKYVGALKLTANDADILLPSLTFQKVGSFTKGRIEEDGVQIAIFQITSTDTTTTATFSPSLTITKGESMVLRIFVEGSSMADQGVVLQNKQSITSSSVSVGGNFPVRLVE